jgi:DNA (cytosine-5)-methyltransferase 1
VKITRPILWDLYCCQGGAGKGYHDIGFEVIGVDIKPQPRYPFRFIQANVLDFLRENLYGPFSSGRTVAAVHASPPCQLDSDCQRIQGRDHPDLIGPTRDLLLEFGVPYVIENVRGAAAKLRDPAMICGPMVGVDMYRHRYFETNWPLSVPPHAAHTAPQVKMGRPAKAGEYIQAVGNFSGVQQAREVMEMPWANRDGLREAIPPAYTRYIGEQLMRHLSADEEMAA